MDGHAAQGELSRRTRDGRVQFRLATLADDPEIRRLLRENPMPGRVSISLEREPRASRAAAIEGDVHHTIVAYQGPGGPVIAMGSVSVRNRYVNGEPTRVGYLGQLRVDHRHRGRMSIIRGGYAKLRELHGSLGVRLYLTSIASANAAARRLVERGLPGMPAYQPLCEFVTLVFRRRRNGEFNKVTGTVRSELRRSRLELRHGGAAHGALVGFSTMLVYETTVAGSATSVVCSGDTIVDPSAWGSPALPREWISAVNRLRERFSNGTYYWLLITSGFRTYRLLSTFWQTFYPCHHTPTPPDQQAVLDALAAERFGDRYDPATGIVRFPHPQLLKPHLAGMPPERMDDPHVAFFARRNPGHVAGDELACLCELAETNLTRAGRRMVFGPGGGT